MISRSRLLEVVNYDPQTGVFTRLLPSSNGANAGDIMGASKSTGHLTGCIDGESYALHRLAWVYMTGSMPKNQIDHINHDPSDNRWINLRDVTAMENQRNRSLNKNNTSGFNGVRWVTRDKMWMSRIKINSKYIHLGYFDTLIDAVAARIRANNEHGFHPNHGVNPQPQ